MFTQLQVQSLVEEHIPSHVRALHTERGWTDFMQAIFELLHSQVKFDLETRSFNNLTCNRERACRKCNTVYMSVETLDLNPIRFGTQKNRFKK